jgi:hypothetical protein
MRRSTDARVLLEGDGRSERRWAAMTREVKDVIATGLTVLVVLVFLATHEGWGVWLIGDSRRWAAGAIALLGMATCGLGTPGKDKATKFLATLGILAVVLAGLALATGSLTPLSLLVVDIVLLWALSTLRHVVHVGERPIAT